MVLYYYYTCKSHAIEFSFNSKLLHSLDSNRNYIKSA